MQYIHKKQHPPSSPQPLQSPPSVIRALYVKTDIDEKDSSIKLEGVIRRRILKPVVVFTCVSSSLLAVECMKSTQFDVIIVENLLQDLTGAELINILFANHYSLPVILLVKREDANGFSIPAATRFPCVVIPDPCSDADLCNAMQSCLRSRNIVFHPNKPHHSTTSPQYASMVAGQCLLSYSSSSSFSSSSSASTSACSSASSGSMLMMIEAERIAKAERPMNMKQKRNELPPFNSSVPPSNKSKSVGSSSKRRRKEVVVAESSLSSNHSSATSLPSMDDGEEGITTPRTTLSNEEEREELSLVDDISSSFLLRYSSLLRKEK